MKHRYLLVCLIVLFFSPQTGFAQSIAKSGIDDQVSVKVTVYNNNLGLVKDIRSLALPKGEGELRFMDVASHIMPVTVHAKSLNYPEGFAILEQNYEYDLINADKLLDKYVGEKVKLINWNTYQDRKDEVEAILLSNNNGQIYKIHDEIYLGHPGYKVLPKVPENLIAKPTLMWLFENRDAKKHTLEVSYLTSNISWKADYVLVLNKDDTLADLSGWVTVDNRSGATYKDAGLKLVAGEVHRVAEREEPMFYAAAKALTDRAPQIQEKAFFEYHIYDLQRKTTIKDKQTKQVRLIEATHVGVEKELLAFGIQSYFKRKYVPQDSKQPVNVYINFQNSKNNNLGMPLPAGIVRLYKKDQEASLQFVGEDRIEHTPKDEKVKLNTGESFDVVAERIQTDYKQITTGKHESEWEITLKNHKEEDIRVGIVEPLFDNWTVLQSSHKYKKVDAFTLRFDVDVPKDGEVKVKYRVAIGL